MGAETDIRRYRPEDLDGVLEVLKAALGETPILRRTPELWAWKHEHNPFGRSLVLVAELEGRIAGVRALMRWDLALPDGTLIRCLRAVDTATHPDFGRRGIFRALTTAAVEQARAEGFDLIFNTPNERSGAGYLTMGWREVASIGVMIRPLFRRGRPVNTQAPPQPEDFFNPPLSEVTALTFEARPPHGLRTPRSTAYLAWRFSAHPHAPYRLIAAAASVAVVRPNLRQGRKEVVVSDVLGEPRAEVLRSLARRARANYLVGWFSPGSPERKAAVGAGMLPLPRVRALTLVANPLRDMPLNVFQLNNWDLAMSDLELL